MGKLVDLTGQRFGRLSVVSREQNNKNNKAMWLCKCDCGNLKTILGSHLTSGNTQSCGCQRKDTMQKLLTVHGHNRRGQRSGEYESWRGMIERCTNPNHQAYKDYGGRGIVVCERWRNFENFLADMGSKPSKEYSIERIDVNGNYELSNCKWTTKTEQSRNKRTPKNNASGVDGVSWYKPYSKWAAYITVQGKQIRLGYFDTIEEAAAARKQAEAKYWK